VLSAAVLAATVGLLAACSGGASAADASSAAGASGNEDLTPLRFAGPANPPPGVKAWPIGVVGYEISLGKADEALKPYGFKYADYVTFQNTTQATAAVQSGSADLVTQGQAPAILARAGGGTLRVIAAGQNPDSTWVLTPKDSSITDITELKGKTVGAGFGTNFEQGFLWGLQDAGVDPRDVKLTNIVVNTGEAALQKGAVDAFATSTQLGQLWEKDGYHVIWKSQDHPEDQAASVTAVREDFAKAHPKIQAAYWSLYRAGLADFKKDEDAYYKWVGEQQGITAAQAKIASPVTEYDTPITPEAVTILKQGVDFFVSVGHAQKSFNVDDWLLAPAGQTPELVSSGQP
jgi:sulfonate transport system substrate-binding protein